ncbi:MAG: hypothetical protein RR326_07685 [Stenotrophomonas sp.]
MPGGGGRLGITGSAGLDNNFSCGVALSDGRDGGSSDVANVSYQGRHAALSGSCWSIQ